MADLHSLADRAIDLWLNRETDQLHATLATTLDVCRNDANADRHSIYVLLHVWSRAAGCREDFFRTFETFETELCHAVTADGCLLLWDTLTTLCFIRQNWEPLLDVYDKLCRSDPAAAHAVIMDVVKPCAITGNKVKLMDIFHAEGFRNRLRFIWHEISGSLSTFQIAESEFSPMHFVLLRLFSDLECFIWALTSSGHLDAASQLCQELAETVENDDVKEKLHRLSQIATAELDIAKLQHFYLEVNGYCCSNSSREMLDNMLCKFIA